MPPASRITRLLERQSRELAALQDDQARKLLALAETARRELAANLAALTTTGGGNTFTAQHLRVLLAQTTAAVDALKARMADVLTAGRDTAGRVAMRDLLQTIRAHEGELADAGNRIEWGAVARLQDGLALHKYSLDKYGADVIAKVQQQLSLGLLQGATIPALTRRVASTSGVFAKLHGRAELIARMEVSNAYNAGHQAAIEEAAAILDDEGTDDPLLRQADEFFDARNHPFSRVIHGQVTGITTPWLVSVAAVAAMGERMHKGTSGVLWPGSGGLYVCQQYPMCYGERGRFIPYRASWDGGAGLRGLLPEQQRQLPTALRRKLAA